VPAFDEPIIPHLPFGLKEGLESSGSAIMFLSENGRKIKRKILRLISRPIVGIVYSEQTREERTCDSCFETLNFSLSGYLGTQTSEDIF